MTMKMCNIKQGYTSPRISSEYTDCSLPLTFDSYNICGFGFGKQCAGCIYCFASSQRVNHPMYEKKAFQIKSVNPERTVGMLNGKVKSKYYDNFFKYRFPFHWGGLADPFCKLEEKAHVGLKILQGASKIQYPIIFSTKGTFMCYDKEYLKVFNSYRESKNLGFSFSIITNEERLAKQIEKGVPSVEDRFKAMKVISDMGLWTVLRLRPFMLGISDINLETLLERAKKAGARAISTEFYCLDLRSLSTLNERIQTISDISGIDYIKYYKALSPGSRGTYLRLNRLVKEHYMKRLFKKCKELDLKIGVSDPDFKEYNFSGCCCAYPASKKEYNSEICNWSRGQLTYHLTGLRKKYWAGERPALLTWDEVKETIANDWAHDKRYFKDSIKYWSTDFRKKQQSHIDEFLETWNNTKSSASPYNYFDGILQPNGLDTKGNIIYRYEPSDSELRLRKEGIV